MPEVIRPDSDLLEDALDRAIRAVIDDPILSQCINMPTDDTIQTAFVPLLRAFRYKEVIDALGIDSFTTIVVEDILASAHSRDEVTSIVTSLDEARRLLPAELGEEAISDCLRSCLKAASLNSGTVFRAEDMVNKWWQNQAIIQDTLINDENAFASPADYIAAKTSMMRI